MTPVNSDRPDFDHGPFDPDELVRWAEMYGHPEEWAKRAQAAHAKYERFIEELTAKLNAAGVPAMPSWPDAIDWLIERAQHPSPAALDEGGHDASSSS